MLDKCSSKVLIQLQVQTEAEAVNVKSSGFELFSVAIGPQILHKELLIIASSVLHVYPSTNTDLIHHIYRKYAPNCPGSVYLLIDILYMRHEKLYLQICMPSQDPRFGSACASMLSLAVSRWTHEEPVDPWLAKECPVKVQISYVSMMSLSVSAGHMKKVGSWAAKRVPSRDLDQPISPSVHRASSQD